MQSARRLSRLMVLLALSLLPVPLRAQVTAFTNANVSIRKPSRSRSTILAETGIAGFVKGSPEFNGTTSIGRPGSSPVW